MPDPKKTELDEEDFPFEDDDLEEKEQDDTDEPVAETLRMDLAALLQHLRVGMFGDEGSVGMFGDEGFE